LQVIGRLAPPDHGPGACALQLWALGAPLACAWALSALLWTPSAPSGVPGRFSATVDAEMLSLPF